MIIRDIYRARKIGNNVMQQPYPFSLQSKYLKRKKGPVHGFLKQTFLKGASELFLNPEISSASSAKHVLPCHPVTEERLYNERNPLDVLLVPVERVTGGEHFFSRMARESMAYVDKRAALKYLRNIGEVPMLNAMRQHPMLQSFFMQAGAAEATEVPVWSDAKQLTGFIDLLYLSPDGTWWILDYKPGARYASNKFATAQLLEYRRLFYERTGIMCRLAYFDEKDTYILNV